MLEPYPSSGLQTPPGSVAESDVARRDRF